MHSSFGKEIITFNQWTQKDVLKNWIMYTFNIRLDFKLPLNRPSLIYLQMIYISNLTFLTPFSLYVVYHDDFGCHQFKFVHFWVFFIFHVHFLWWKIQISIESKWKKNRIKKITLIESYSEVKCSKGPPGVHPSKHGAVSSFFFVSHRAGEGKLKLHTGIQIVGWDTCRCTERVRERGENERCERTYDALRLGLFWRIIPRPLFLPSFFSPYLRELAGWCLELCTESSR